MELGVGEANFIMNYAIEMSGNNLIIFFVKAVPISILGVLLYFYQKILKREDRKKIRLPHTIVSKGKMTSVRESPSP